MYYEVLAVGPDRGHLIGAVPRAGALVGPLVDPSASEHYIMTKGRVFEWLLSLLGEKRVLAIALFPPDARRGLLVPGNAVIPIAVVRSQVITTAKPPDGLFARLVRNKQPHIGVGCRNVGVARMNHQGYTHCFKAPASELWSTRAGRGRQVRTKHMGKIDPGFFENSTAG